MSPPAATPSSSSFALRWVGPHAAGAMIVGLLAIPMSMILNKEVQVPFMDEEFHSPAAAAVCKGNWSGAFHPAITTPPGAYYLSAAMLYPLRYVVPVEDSCGIAALRTTAVIALIALAWVSSKVATRVHPEEGVQGSSLRAACVALYPPLFFSAMLYYTDAFAAAAIVGSFYAAVVHSPVWFAVFAVVSVSLRQTSIVWVAWIAGIVAVKLFRDAADADMFQRVVTSEGKRVFAIPKNLLHALWQSIICLIIAIVLTVLFGVWVRRNGGIVLGHQEYHAPSFHSAQFVYCALTIGISLCPALGVSFQTIQRLSRKNRIQTCLSVLVACFFLYGAVAHPFLLADNRRVQRNLVYKFRKFLPNSRHFTFYLWKDALSKPLLRYSLGPVVVAAWCVAAVGIAMASGAKESDPTVPVSPEVSAVRQTVFAAGGQLETSLGSEQGARARKSSGGVNKAAPSASKKRRVRTSFFRTKDYDWLWAVSFFLATLTVTVPAPLFEFRYYSIPFTISWLWFVVMTFGVVNLATVLLFAFRTFEFGNTAGRFMW